MVKRIIGKIIDYTIYALCVLFCMSSIFVLLSFTPIESIAFSNDAILVCVFLIVVIVSIILGHHLNRLFVILQGPASEWKSRCLKR